MKKNIILALLGGALLFSSCDDLFSPAKENFKTLDQIETEPDFGKSFLI